MVNAFGEFVVGKSGLDGLVIGLLIFIIFIAVFRFPLSVFRFFIYICTLNH